MAAESSNQFPAMASYEPLGKPVVVVGPQFLARYPLNFTIDELGNDLNVVDANGTHLFKIDSKFFTLHKRRKLLDADNNTLITFYQKLLTVHSTSYVYRGDSTDQKDLLFSVKTSHFLKWGTLLNVFLAGNKEQNIPDFRVKGTSTDCYGTIYLGKSEKILAQMDRRREAKIFSPSKYPMTVHPNVDYVFIIALEAILIELEKPRTGLNFGALSDVSF